MCLSFIYHTGDMETQVASRLTKTVQGHKMFRYIDAMSILKETDTDDGLCNSYVSWPPDILLLLRKQS